MRGRRLLAHAVPWLALAVATSGVWAISERAFRRQGRPSAVVVSLDVPYRDADGPRLTLDVYRPPSGATNPGPGPGRPAILAIHGGSWNGGSKRLLRPSLREPKPFPLLLAESGYVVIAADYRLARPGSPGWPAALDDLRDAVRWIRRHARELGVDPDRIAALGQSAGAHLALLLGTATDDGDPTSRVQAVIDLYGPSDLERLPGQRVRPLANEPVRAFLGPQASHDPETVRDASPIHRVRRDSAPTLIVHGTRDRWVPIQQSDELDRALQAAGVLHHLIRIENAQHGFGPEVKDPEVPGPLPLELRGAILDFLGSVWDVSSR